MLPQCLLRMITFCVKKCNFLECIHIFGLTVLQFCGTSGMNLVLSKRLLLIALPLFEITLVLSQWFYVPSSSNPADKATRIMPAAEFLKCSLWKNGPPFLQNFCAMWPAQPDFLSVSSETDVEFKLAPKVCNVCVSVCTTVNDLFCKYSKWTKLKSVIAWLLRFQNNLQRSRSENAQNRCFRKENSKTIQPLSVEELHEAEIQIVKFLQQRKYFSDELQFYPLVKR